MKTVIVYHKDGTKSEHKSGGYVGCTQSQDDAKWDAHYHQNINKTYYELEQRGELREYSPERKTEIRDLHFAAQDSRYWNSP